MLRGEKVSPPLPARTVCTVEVAREVGVVLVVSGAEDFCAPTKAAIASVHRLILVCMLKSENCDSYMSCVDTVERVVLCERLKNRF